MVLAVVLFASDSQLLRSIQQITFSFPLTENSQPNICCADLCYCCMHFWHLREQIWTVVERLVCNALIFTHLPLHCAEQDGVFGENNRTSCGNAVTHVPQLHLNYGLEKSMPQVFLMRVSRS